MGNDLILHISGLSMWTPATPPPPTVITTTLTRTQTFSRMETHQNPPVTVSWRELSCPARELCRKSREFTCDLQCCREWTDFRGAYHENDSSEYSRKISSDSEFYADPSSPSWFWRKDLYASINIIWGFVGSETVKTQTELRQIILISYHNEINYQFLKSLLHRFKYFVNLCLYSVSVTDSGILCILEKIFSDYWVVTFYHFSISRWTQFNCISFLMDISLQRRKNDFLNELSLLRDF